MIRRQVKGNRLSRMLTLTCRDQTTDRALFVRRVAEFMKDWRRVWGPMPYVVAYELHKSGAWHAHIAVSGERFYKHSTVRDVWGHGHVWITAQAPWWYLAKYLGKQDVTPAGQHRYEVGQGYQPARVRVAARDWDSAWAMAVAAMGGEVPSYEWHSGQLTDWRGPPVFFLAWDP